jgi:hypothetical protein
MSAQSYCDPVRQYVLKGSATTSSTLEQNPYGYCPDHGTGVSCPIGVGVTYGTGVKADTAES